MLPLVIDEAPRAADAASGRTDWTRPGAPGKIGGQAITSTRTGLRRLDRTYLNNFEQISLAKFFPAR